MQRELSSLGLPWNSSLNGLAAITPGLGLPASRTSAAWIAAGAFATVTLVAIVAVLSLRRHRKLIDDLLAAVSLRREDVTLVIRTGGSSLIVAVKTLLESMFPGKVAAHDPFTSVAGGLAIANYYGYEFGW